MKPSRINTLLQQAMAHHTAGRLDAAEKLYRELRRLAPTHFDVMHLSGTAALQQGRFAEAAEWLRSARRQDPRNAACALRLGLALISLERWSEAEKELRAAVTLDGKNPEAWLYLGFAQWRLGRLDDAVASFREAIRLRPDYAEAHDRLGGVLVHTLGHAAAEPHFRQAVTIQPGFANAWCNLGICLFYRGEISEAARCYRRALEIDPRAEKAHTGLGLALERCYDLRGALNAYGAALAINPANHEARSARLMVLQYSPQDRAGLAAEHRAYGLAVEPAAFPERSFPNAADPDRPLRVGFLSPDLHRHSVAYFLEPILAHLDRGQFEVVLYHDSAKTDAMSARLREVCSVWRPVAGRPDQAVEALIRSDQLDVLIDLAGHTGFNRLPLFARRLAPVQATYLGYPDTTGLRSMDYRLVDLVTDPVGEADPFCTERLFRFAPTAWTYAPPSGAAQPERRPPGPEGVVFGCFNNICKINDDVLVAWGRLLAAVPDARLVLKGAGLTVPAIVAPLRCRLAAVGLDPERVILWDRLANLEEHFAAYGQMDIALDTFPYHGTTTTCEALWMGVPVVTIRGDRHASRVGASLLSAVGHPEWIGADADDYIRIASGLAADVERVRRGRADLRAAMSRSALLDHAGQAARFGAALRAMWRAWCGQAVTIAA